MSDSESLEAVEDEDIESSGDDSVAASDIDYEEEDEVAPASPMARKYKCDNCGKLASAKGVPICPGCWPRYVKTGFPPCWDTFCWWLVVGMGRHQLAWAYRVPFRTLWTWDVGMRLSLNEMPPGATAFYLYGTRRGFDGTYENSPADMTPAGMDLRAAGTSSGADPCVRLGDAVTRATLRAKLEQVITREWRSEGLVDSIIWHDDVSAADIAAVIARSAQLTDRIRAAVPSFPAVICQLVYDCLWSASATRARTCAQSLVAKDEEVREVSERHEREMNALIVRHRVELERLRGERKRLSDAKRDAENGFRVDILRDVAFQRTAACCTELRSLFTSWYRGDGADVPIPAKKRQKLS